jgi:hypothetical protein
MARRRHRNPAWYRHPLFIGVTSFVAGVGVTALAYARRTDVKDTYYYWAQPGFGTGFIPKFQNARTGDIFKLESRFDEQSALTAARDEIERRGGIAQQGKPAKQIQ